ncbi:MAG: DNA-binding response regulator [Campylobacterota bacterium]|nr:DNA-binding response regulator [Campylobacterota bacterium]
MPKIVIVEDELIAAEYLKQIIIRSGFDVLDIINNGKDAMEKIPKLCADIVLMDIMLKDNISGSEVALSLKQNSPNTIVIFLTAYSDKEMVDYAMQSNCYGYMIKPYKEDEIINTLKVLSARFNKIAAPKAIDAHLVTLDGNLVFDMNLRRLFRENKEIELGQRALRLIELLCKQPNVTVENEKIYLCVWEESRSATTLRTLIYRIRGKVGKNIIHNVNGLGYMIKS